MSDYKPEVGEEGLMRDGNDIFQEVEIIARKHGYYIGWDNKNNMVYHSNLISDFRPIRTQEELERDAAITEMIDATEPTVKNRRLMAETLYDAGYRLVGEKVSSKEFIASFELNKIPLYLFVDNYDIYRKVVK